MRMKRYVQLKPRQHALFTVRTSLCALGRVVACVQPATAALRVRSKFECPTLSYASVSRPAAYYSPVNAFQRYVDGVSVRSGPWCWRAGSGTRGGNIFGWRPYVL